MLNLYDGNLYININPDITNWNVKFYLSKRSTDIATVSFANNAAASIKVCTGTDITSKLPELTPADNKIFIEWYTDKDCTQAFTGTVSDNTTLYYKWNDTKDIMSLYDGTCLYKEDLTQYAGMALQYTVHHPASTTSKWAGFLGWTWGDCYESDSITTADTTLTYTHAVDDMLSKPCIKAEWNNDKEFFNFNLCDAWILESLVIINEDPSTITFNYQDGTEPTTISAYDGDDITSQLPTPTSADKLFAGWYTDSSCSTEFNGIVNGDATLYAKWSDEVVLTKEKSEDSANSYYSYDFNNLETYRSYTNAVISITVKNTSAEEKVFGFTVVNKPISISSEGIAVGETKTFTCKVYDFTDEWVDDGGHIGLRINSNEDFELVSAVIQIPNE